MPTPPAAARKKKGSKGRGGGAADAQQQKPDDDDHALASADVFVTYTPRSVLKWPALAAAPNHPGDVAEPVSLK
jgi:hypothetical protein